MILTRKQEEGLKIAVQRHKNHDKMTIISGFAGVGKSVLIKFIIEALQVSPDKVAYAAFTGKAAEVLRQKGNKNAVTLHRLLYDSVPLPAGGFRKIPKKTLDYDVIVIDEVSMVPKKMMDLLMSHNAYLICTGDPFQLPPIEKDNDNHLLDTPHIFLDEIMRQAQESEIIRLTMDIREQKPLSIFKGNEVQVVNKNSLVTGMYAWADQILVATNLMRHAVNDQIREIKGYGPDPCDGDKVICLRNDWETFSSLGNPLVNGTIGTLVNPRFDTVRVPFYAYNPGIINVLASGFTTEIDGDYGLLHMDPRVIQGGESELEWRDKYKLGKLRDRIGDVVPKEFDYAYAITCHKAQGDSWKKVMVIEEHFPRVKLEHARWLYTACTRAEEKLLIVKKN